ncbi:MAG: putative lipid II flippase FtsW [Frankiaceae bacterium]
MSQRGGVATAPAARSADVQAVRQPLLERPLTSYYLVLGSAALLTTIGLVMVLSASSVTAYVRTGSSYYYFVRQSIGVLLGLPAMWIAMRLPVRVYRWLGYPLLLFSVALLLLVPFVGSSAYGAKRWLDLGVIQIQPSEPAKLALVLFGADLLCRKERLLDQWRHLLVPLLPVFTVLAALVMLQPDMGTTIVLLAITLSLLWIIGAPGRLFGVLSIAAASLMAVMIVVEPYRLRRFAGFWNPWADQLHSGYQAAQGMLTLASGGWWGLGLGASRQKWSYLPNQYTDYIFAIIGEELGLIGTIAVVGLFGALGFAGIRIARRSRDPFCQLAAGAVTCWLLAQALVNIGAVVGLLPITGIPLPLVSYGGSALIPSMFAVGMLAAFARREPGAAAALAARGPSPFARVLPGPLRGATGRFRRGGGARDGRSATARRSRRRQSSRRH